MGGHLNGGPRPASRAARRRRSIADQAHNDARATRSASVGDAGVAAYEAALPDDGGGRRGRRSRTDIERFGAAFFTWNGGYNYTDNPAVTCSARSDGDWADYADQSGEMPVTRQVPAGRGRAALPAGRPALGVDRDFEAFVARYDLGEAGPRATPAGTYRFVSTAAPRAAASVDAYHVESQRFTCSPGTGITVERRARRADRTVSFVSVGPRHTVRRDRRRGAGDCARSARSTTPTPTSRPVRFIHERAHGVPRPGRARRPRQDRVVLLHLQLPPVGRTRRRRGAR